MTSKQIPFHRATIGQEEIDAVTAVLRSGWLTTGEQCRHFEAEMAAFLGVKHAVAVNSCTAALHLALANLHLKRGDLVLVPTLTFAATAEVVTYFGATPLLIDCEPESLCLDVEAARAVAESYRAGPLRAIIPVHYGGQMADVDGVAALAQRYQLRVIDDAAHALPAAARGPSGEWRSIGTTAEQTCLSFYANKTITTGEGGMLVTDDEALATRARSLSLHGLSADAWRRYQRPGAGGRYAIHEPGYKYNLTDVAAALGRTQLRKAESLCAARARLVARYRLLLEDVEELELPTVRSDRRSSHHLYVVRLHLDRLAITRDQFIEELAARGVGTSVHWMPLHLHPYYRDRHGYRPGDLPVAAREWLRMISLPLYPGMTEAEQIAVTSAVREVVRRNTRLRGVA